MAVIDTLNVNLQAVTAGLAKGLKSASGMVKGFAGSLNGPLGQITAALGAAFSVSAAANFVSSGLEAADTLMDTANALQVNAEALNQLRHAAVVSDVSFEQLAGGIERLNKNLGTSDDGARDMVDFLNTIGLLNTQWEHLQQLAPDQAFLRLAGAISKIEDPYLKAEAAVRIFGKSGQDLIPFLNQGEEGIKKLGAEVAGAFSPENQKKFDEADAAFKSIAEALLKAKQEAAVALAPTLVEITKEFEKWLKTLKEIVELLRTQGPDGPGKNRGDQGSKGSLGVWGQLLGANKSAFKTAYLTGDIALQALTGNGAGAVASMNRAAAQYEINRVYRAAGPNANAADVQKMVDILERLGENSKQVTELEKQQLELMRRNLGLTQPGVEL